MRLGTITSLSFLASVLNNGTSRKWRLRHSQLKALRLVKDLVLQVLCKDRMKEMLLKDKVFSVMVEVVLAKTVVMTMFRNADSVMRRRCFS